MATQFVGFGVAGLTRRFLIKPKAMLFPSVLPQVSMFSTLHKPDTRIGRWSMTRFKFFWYALGQCLSLGYRSLQSLYIRGSQNSSPLL